MHLPVSRIAAVSVLLVAGSCTPIRPGPIKTPLLQPRMSPDSVVLDMFFVRFPFGDEEANGPLWDEIDELHFPSDLRRELSRRGFRVGVIGAQIPATLARLLDLTEKPPPTKQVPETSLEDLDEAPTVTRRHKQLRAGKPCEIQVSEVYEELPVVTSSGGQICGRSYQGAQAILVIKAFPEPANRVRLEISPQIQYGQPKPQYVGANGTLRLEVARACHVFNELVMSAGLAPGEMVVLGSTGCRPGSLGHYFFNQETAGRQDQKLLIVRLSQVQHDDLFDPQSVLPLETLEE